MNPEFCYDHFSEVKGDELAAWRKRWPDFSPREMASRDAGKVCVDVRALDMLQRLRDRLDVPLVATSAYRTPAHNRAVGGVSNSYHLKAQAFDIRVSDVVDPETFIRVAREVGFNGIGTYPQQGFIHVDARPDRGVWGDAFKTDARDLPVTENTEKSPERRVTEVAGVLTAGAGVAKATEGIDLIGLGFVIVACALAYYLYAKTKQPKMEDV